VRGVGRFTAGRGLSLQDSLATPSFSQYILCFNSQCSLPHVPFPKNGKVPGCLGSLLHLLHPAQRTRKIPPRERTTSLMAAFPRRRTRGCLRTPTVLLPIPLCPGHHRESLVKEGGTRKIPRVEVVLPEMERSLNGVLLSQGRQHHIQVERRHDGYYPRCHQGENGGTQL
jgi:hypothetical protein